MDDIWYRNPKTFAVLVLFAIFLNHKDRINQFMMRRILSKLHIRSGSVESVAGKLEQSTTQQESVTDDNNVKVIMHVGFSL